MSGSAFDVSVIRRDDGSEVLPYNCAAVHALQQERTDGDGKGDIAKCVQAVAACRDKRERYRESLI